MSSIESKITKSVSYQFLNLIVSGLAGVFFIPFIISSLGKDQYGIFEIAFSLNIINSVLDIGIGSTITNYAKKYFDLEGKEFSEFFWTFFWLKVFLSIIGLLICIFIAENVEYIFQKVSKDSAVLLRQAIIWFGVGVLIQNLNSFIDGIVNGFIRFDMTSFASICSKFFYVLAFFIWFYLGDLSIVEFSLLTFVLVPLVKLITQLMQVILYTPEIITFPVSPKISYIKDTANYLGGISFVTISAQLFNHGTQIMLAIIASPVLVGEFGILQRIIRLVRQVSDMLVRPVLPAAHDLKKKYSIKKIITKGTNIHSIIVIGVIFIMLINGENISRYYLQSEYPNFSLHLTILGAQMLVPSFAIMLMLYYNEGKSKMSVQFNVFNTLISISLAYLGVKFFGFLGFIVGLTLGYIICILFQLMRYLRYYEISILDYLKIYGKIYFSISASFAGYLLINSIITDEISRIIFSNIIALTILGVFSWYSLDQSLKDKVLQMVKRET
ncbi:lipopolysaccharide biosynthesis protein [Gracilimonas sp.]|uniref:lipopolysaccharide biosynthesis protein n=1 Tax=Gracilimonas sp. TaxID=1974203 RepID=UPI003BAC59B3